MPYDEKARNLIYYKVAAALLKLGYYQYAKKHPLPRILVDRIKEGH